MCLIQFFNIHNQRVHVPDSYVVDIERQLETEPMGNDLTSVNIMMQKQQIIETQLQVKSVQVSELETQAEKLIRMEPDKEVMRQFFKDSSDSSHAKCVYS